MSAFSLSETALLGKLEQLVMFAVIRRGDDAHAVTIRAEILERTRIALARGTIYVTLARLERKGYLASVFGESTPERGGKAKRLFAVTAEGHRALRAAERAWARMRPAPQR